MVKSAYSFHSTFSSPPMVKCQCQVSVSVSLFRPMAHSLPDYLICFCCALRGSANHSSPASPEHAIAFAKAPNFQQLIRSQAQQEEHLTLAFKTRQLVTPHSPSLSPTIIGTGPGIQKATSKETIAKQIKKHVMICEESFLIVSLAE